MKKIGEKEYKLFQTHCYEWQKKLGLENWVLLFHFGLEKKDKEFYYNATIKATLEHYQADVYLDKEYKWLGEKEFNETAKHEMMHLLVGRLAKLGSYRFGVVTADLDSAEEELIHKLEHLIK